MSEVSKIMMLCILLDMTGTMDKTDTVHKSSSERHKSTGHERQTKVKQQYTRKSTPVKSYKTRK